LQRYDSDDWRLQPFKGQTATMPTYYHYEPAWPAGQLYVWPIVTAGSATALILYIWTPITSLPTFTTVVDLPSGYYRALRDNLAIELAPELGVEVMGTLALSAGEAVAQLKRVNYRPRVLHMPAGMPNTCPGAYDWRTDE
jgi:hypothetical protein